jgi:phospholipase C
VPLLKGIDHIVVLMMENRSFDQMLGYLSLPASLGGEGRTDVDGLTGSEVNHNGGAPFQVRRLTNTALPRDPHHDWDSVKEQIETPGSNGRPMGGFVANYSTVSGVTTENAGEVMGYYTATEVPTLDFLARHFCVCDRWFCSFPGPTIPNRLFSLAGTSRRVGADLLKPFTLPSVFEVLEQRDVSWEIYFEDIAPALALFSGHGEKDDPHMHGLDFLLKRPASRPLPAAAWIDPFFLTHKDDDHPPADIARGQLLVHSVYEALRKRSEWPRTLLIVTYDEHGGYYDHVTPPGFDGGPPILDDSPDPGLPGGYNPFKRLGPRVPALLISPRIKQRVCKETLDHTSIVRTLLEQFCPDLDDALRDMPLRVRDFSKPIPPSIFEAPTLALPAAAGEGVTPEISLRPRRGGRRPSARGRRAAAAKARKPGRTQHAALEETLSERRKTLRRAPRRKSRRKTPPVSALQRELRPVLERLGRRGVVNRRQLPPSWRSR